jgi:FkbM family methyltransferase
VTKSNYVLSNYGVWLSKNTSDKTFNLSLLGYRNNLEKFISRVNEPSIFIDIGANQGIFSIIAARNQNFVEIHAFEPNLKVVKFLENNFKFNKINNGVIHKYAIAEKNGTHKFLVPEYHSGAGKLSTKLSNMEVKCVNHNYLDKFFRKLNYSYFIKIDVEGSELMVLTELLRSKIESCINKIFVEVTDTSSSEKKAMYLLLENLGFKEVYVKKLNKNGFDIFFVR